MRAAVQRCAKDSRGARLKSVTAAATLSRPRIVFVFTGAVTCSFPRSRPALAWITQRRWWFGQRPAKRVPERESDGSLLYLPVGESLGPRGRPTGTDDDPIERTFYERRRLMFCVLRAMVDLARDSDRARPRRRPPLHADGCRRGDDAGCALAKRLQEGATRSP